MKKIACLVVEDEPLARKVICDYVQLSDDLELVAECSNALDAYSILNSGKVDLLFIDIKMPVLSGIQLMKNLPSPPPFVLMSAYSQYAVESYEINTLDYLLKPIKYDRFRKSIDKYLDLQRKKQAAENEESTSFFLRTVNGIIKLKFRDILWTKAMQNYVQIVTDKGNYTSHQTMKSMEHTLPESLFIRVHRSYIVNAERIQKIDLNAIYIQNIEIPIGGSYKKQVKIFFNRKTK